MQIIIDENIPLAKEAFSEFGDIHLLPGQQIHRQTLKHADAVIVRAVTPIDRKTLEQTPVRFVGTATIGTDHIDVDFLRKNGIAFANAAGCNADAVAEYVFTAIAVQVIDRKLSFQDLTLGVIGVGNIGSRVVRLATALKMRVLQNDPPLQRQTGNAEFIELADVLQQADILTLHVPLNRSGQDKTFHLINEKQLAKLKKGAIIINASRGPVVGNQALLKHLQSNSAFVAVLDVWENEPDIDIELLKRVTLGTPHIAGYSLEGKVNGTKMIYEALCKFLQHQGNWHPELPAMDHSCIQIDGRFSVEQALHQALSQVYDIHRDDTKMRKLSMLAGDERPAYFNHLRKTYPFRRECPNFKAQISPYNELIAHTLRTFRFEILS